MDKSLNIPIKINQHHEQKNLIINFEDHHMKDLCLNLCLLERLFIESILIISEQPLLKLKIQKDAQLSKNQRGRVLWHTDFIDLKISETELDTWIHFFLKYYRDGVGDVDHYDLDIYAGHNSTNNIYLTLGIPNSRPPILSEQLIHLLNKSKN